MYLYGNKFKKISMKRKETLFYLILIIYFLFKLLGSKLFIVIIIDTFLFHILNNKKINICKHIQSKNFI